MNIACLEVEELVDDRHDIRLDCVPTSLGESPGVAIRSRRLSLVVLSTAFFTSSLKKVHRTKIIKVACRRWHVCPIEILIARRASLDFLYEVAMDDVFLLFMIRDPTIMLEM
jgi:hypothetical protein